MTIGLALACGCVSRAPGLRRLGLAALALVILQGVLGGLRVVLLEQTLAIVHRQRRSSFFALTVCLAVSRRPAGLMAPSRRRLMTATVAPPGRCHHGACVWANRLSAVLPIPAKRVDAHLTLAALVTLHVIFIIIRVMKDHSTNRV